MNRMKTSDVLLKCEDERNIFDHGLIQLPVPDEESNEVNATNILPPSNKIFKEDVPRTQTVVPKIGFCIKTKDDAGQKVFINIGTSGDLPPPPDISEAKLSELLESEEPSSFKVPMSLGYPRSGTDKHGQRCSIMDVVINDSFFKKVQHIKLFKVFVITVILEGLESKHNIQLDKQDWIELLNKKYFGTGTMPNVTFKKKLISELDINGSQVTLPSKTADQKLIPKTPEFILTQDPPQGSPVSVSAEIKLPGITLASHIELLVNDDRIVLNASVKGRKIYFMDIFLPVDIKPDEAVSQYNVKNQILYISSPCAKLT